MLRDDHGKDSLLTANDLGHVPMFYVDGVLLSGGNKDAQPKLMSNFKMSDIGDVPRVLGMQVTRDTQE